MTIQRRRFLHLAAGAAALPVLPRASFAQALSEPPDHADRAVPARRLD